MTLWQPGMRITADRLQDATDWVPLVNLGSYQNGSSAAAVSGAMARDLYVRDEVVRQFKGIVNLSGITTASYNFFMFNSTYLPDYEREWGAGGMGNSAAFRVFLSTAGNWGITGQATGLTSIRLDQFQIMSATGRI